MDTTVGRLLTEGDGYGWPRSRKLLVGIMAIILSVSGVLLAMSTSAVQPFQPTNTVLSTSPPYPLTSVSPVPLTATIIPSAATGTVQFKDGILNIGIPVAVDNGTASGTTRLLSGGWHSLTAVFTPSDPAAFGPSTSPEQFLRVDD